MKPFGMIGIGAVAGFALGALAMNLSETNLANASGQTMSQAQVEKIVHDYIAGHGDELMTSIQNSISKTQMEKASKLVSGNTPSKGPIDAPVTVVEFSDFQCPFCDRVQPTLTDLRAKYGDKVRWVFKALPLEFHPQARPAVYAAMAAQRQGKFWEYGQQLWQKQDQLGEKTYVAIAQDLKLDMDKFNKDRASAEVKAQVDADNADAEAMGARGTPYFLINGQGVSGALPEETFTAAIDAELAKVPAKK